MLAQCIIFLEATETKVEIKSKLVYLSMQIRKKSADKSPTSEANSVLEVDPTMLQIVTQMQQLINILQHEPTLDERCFMSLQHFDGTYFRSFRNQWASFENYMAI